MAIKNPKLSPVEVANADSVIWDPDLGREWLDVIPSVIEAGIGAVDTYKGAKAGAWTTEALKQNDDDVLSQLALSPDKREESFVGEESFIQRQTRLRNAMDQGTISTSSYEINKKKLLKEVMAKNPGRDLDVLRAAEVYEKTNNVGTILQLLEDQQTSRAKAVEDELNFVRDQGIALGIPANLWYGTQAERQEFLKSYEYEANRQFQAAKLERGVRMEEDSTKLNSKEFLQTLYRDGVPTVITGTMKALDETLMQTYGKSFDQINELAMSGQANADGVRQLLEQVRLMVRSDVTATFLAMPGASREEIDNALAPLDDIFTALTETIGTENFNKHLANMVSITENQFLLQRPNAIKLKAISSIVSLLGDSVGSLVAKQELVQNQVVPLVAAAFDASWIPSGVGGGGDVRPEPSAEERDNQLTVVPRDPVNNAMSFTQFYGFQGLGVAQIQRNLQDWGKRVGTILNRADFDVSTEGPVVFEMTMGFLNDYRNRAKYSNTIMASPIAASWLQVMASPSFQGVLDTVPQAEYGYFKRLAGDFLEAEMKDMANEFTKLYANNMVLRDGLLQAKDFGLRVPGVDVVRPSPTNAKRFLPHSNVEYDAFASKSQAITLQNTGGTLEFVVQPHEVAGLEPYSPTTQLELDKVATKLNRDLASRLNGLAATRRNVSRGTAQQSQEQAAEELRLYLLRLLGDAGA